MYSPPQPCTSWCTELSGDPEVTVTLDQFRLSLKPTKSTTGSSVPILNQGCFVFWGEAHAVSGAYCAVSVGVSQRWTTGGGWKECSRGTFLCSHGKLLDERTKIKVYVSFCIHIFFSFWVWERRNYSCLQFLLSLSLISVFFSLCQTRKHKGMDG